ncbi:MAG: CpsD/CapB family tyrosine-protein kinase [Paracoccaceae bacterium]
MEKLQAALEKARLKREGGPRANAPQATPQRTPRPRGTGATDVDALWSSIPSVALRDSALTRHRIVTRNASEQATPFDILRTKILLQMQQHGWSRLAVTSPMPQCGKTTTACNLALGLGRQNNLRAMLFDMDLASPSVHEAFELEPRDSIKRFLTGEISFEEQATRIGENVVASMCPQVENDPTQVLLAERTVHILDEVQETYEPDIMIFDLPSVLKGDNTRAFLKNVDCALIIARAGVTRYGQFNTAEREIAEHTNVLGVVLNACGAGVGHGDVE